LFIVFIPTLAYADLPEEEQYQLDSLNTILNSPSSHDTSLAATYVELSNILYAANQDTVLPLCKIAKQIAETALSSHPPVTVRNSLMVSLAGALNNIGFIRKDQGDIPLALEFYHKSLRLREEIADSVGVATSLNNIGFIYKQQGDIPKALTYYHRSLKLREDIGDIGNIAESLNNIGNIYYQQGDIPKALEYYKKCLKMYETVGNKKGIGSSLNNIGFIHKQQDNIAKALEFYHKSLRLQEEIGNKKSIGNCLNNIGRIYDDQGDMQEALEHYQKGLKMYEQIKYKKGIAISLSNIGYLELSQVSANATVEKQGALERALKYGSRGLLISRELGAPALISNNSRLLSRVAKKQGNYKEALEMYELHIKMRDSIKNEETQKATIRQQTKYEFEKAQLVKEQEENEKHRISNEKLKRRDNLQYSVILIAILALFGGILALGFINVSERMAEGIIFFSFLILFEFLLVLADPYIEGWSGGAPGIKLLFNAGIAALVFPLHSFFEAKLKHRLAK